MYTCSESHKINVVRIIIIIIIIIYYFYHYFIRLFTFISNLNDFCTFFKIPNVPVSLKTEIIKTVIVNSYNIYCKSDSNLYPG